MNQLGKSDRSNSNKCGSDASFFCPGLLRRLISGGVILAVFTFIVSGILAPGVGIQTGCTQNKTELEITIENWPQWRGPSGTGVAPSGNPPLTWSEAENIKWKAAIPGNGHSTPVIWGDRIFLQTAIPLNDKSGTNENGESHENEVKHKFNVMCLDRGTGAVVWEKTAIEATPHEEIHSTGTHANSSPVTDGKYVWANFGSRGLYAYDVDGNLLWSKNLFKMQILDVVGEGSSPVIAGDAIIVVMDHEGESKIFAFNKLTGVALWQRSRGEITSWATPIAVEIKGRIQVIVSATKYTRSYDAETGDVIWKCSGQTGDVIPTPVVGFGNVYCASGFEGHSLQAIKLGNTGDLSGTDAVVWHVTTKATPYVPSPLLYGDNLYVLAGTRGIVSCYDAKRGKPHFERERLSGLGAVYASPLGVANRIYISGLNGKTAVIKHGDSLEVLAINKLDERFSASPVSVGNALYFRGSNHLYCIVEQ